MKIHITRIHVLLIGLLGSIGVLALATSLYPKLSVGLIVVLCVVIIFSAIYKAWLDIALALIVLAITLGARMLPDASQDPLLTIRVAATCAFVFLNLALLIGPWSRFVPALSRVYGMRRHIGVAAWLCALLHASVVLNYFFSFSFEDAYASSFIFFGSIALMTLSSLALTSWDAAQKYIPVKAWMLIHTLFFLFVCAYSTLFYTFSLDRLVWHTIVLLCFATYWLAIAPWSLPKLVLKHVNGWKQLHMLIWVGYAALVIHAWEAYMQYAEPLIQNIYIGLVGFVVLSHLAGLTRALLTTLSERKTTASEHIQINGMRYYATVAPETLIDGKGTRVMVQDIPLALFKNGDSYFALAVRCPHQGGPIDKGTVVNGFVECPWHKYQFSVTDGKGPVGFKDCVPYYAAVVEHNMVYVSAQDTGQCPTYGS